MATTDCAVRFSPCTSSSALAPRRILSGDKLLRLGGSTTGSGVAGAAVGASVGCEPAEATVTAGAAALVTIGSAVARVGVAARVRAIGGMVGVAKAATAVVASALGDDDRDDVGDGLAAATSVAPAGTDTVGVATTGGSGVGRLS